MGKLCEAPDIYIKTVDWTKCGYFGPMCMLWLEVMPIPIISCQRINFTFKFGKPNFLVVQSTGSPSPKQPLHYSTFISLDLEKHRGACGSKIRQNVL